MVSGRSRMLTLTRGSHTAFAVLSILIVAVTLLACGDVGDDSHPATPSSRSPIPGIDGTSMSAHAAELSYAELEQRLGFPVLRSTDPRFRHRPLDRIIDQPGVLIEIYTADIEELTVQQQREDVPAPAAPQESLTINGRRVDVIPVGSGFEARITNNGNPRLGATLVIVGANSRDLLIDFVTTLHL